MSIFFDLYKLKIKIFFGAFRASKAGTVLLFLYVLGMIPATIGMSMGIAAAIGAGVDLTAHLDVLAALISGFLALDLVSTLKGFTAFDYEQSFIFTSPITPREFLIASMLAEITVYMSSFFLPVFIFFGIIIVSLGLSFVTALSMVVSLVAFILFLFFLDNSLSILGSYYQNSTTRIVTALLIALLLFPALGLVASFPLHYSELPYPSTFLADVILKLLYDTLPSTTSFLALAFYLLASLALFLSSSKKNFFQFANPVPLVSPFDTSMRTQTAKMQTNIRFFSRIGLRTTLDLGSESLLRFLMKKELIRMLRDGSLFAVLVFYLIVSIMSVVGRTAAIPFPIWMFLLVVYSFIVPAVLIGNWRISELDNLWVPLTSALNLGYLVKSLLYDFTLIAFVVPAATIVILTFVSQINPLTPMVLVASVSMIGCSTNLFTVMHFLEKERRATPSFMVSWVSMLLSGLLILPTYMYVSISLLLGFNVVTNLLLAVPVLAYSFLIFRLFSKKLEEKALAVEI